MDQAMTAGLGALVEHLRRDGLDARLGPDCAFLGVGEAALVVPWSQFQSSADGQLHSANLRVALRSGQGRPLVFEDMVAHLGRSREEAAASALVRVWLHGDLPPILPLLGGPGLPDLAVIRQGDAHGCPPWVVYCGPPQLSGPRQEEFGRALLERPPLGMLRELFGKQVDPTRPHWVKLFRCRDEEGGSDQADCLVDFRHVESGRQLLMDWPWPSVGGRHVFRQFLVLLPEGREPGSALGDLERGCTTPEAAVARLADLVAARAEFSEDDIYREMAEAGMPEAVADRAYKFTQTAWARTLLAGIGVRFPPDYLGFDAAGDVIESGPLDQNAYYAAAAALVPVYAQSPGFSRLVRMSADLGAVNRAVHAGSKPEDLSLAPAAFFFEAPTQEGMARARQVLAQRPGPSRGTT